MLKLFWIYEGILVMTSATSNFGLSAKKLMYQSWLEKENFD